MHARRPLTNPPEPHARVAQLRNEADTAIYSTEKSLNEYKSKLPQVGGEERRAHSLLALL